MGYTELITELKLKNRIFAVNRVNADEYTVGKTRCMMPLLKKLFDGEEVIFAENTCSCAGYKSNSGFTNERPNIPGGCEYFLSYGREGFMPGERMKISPEIAAAFFDNYPRDILTAHNAYRITPYSEDAPAEVVWAFAEPDQLSALALLYTFRRTDPNGGIFASTAAGCGSLFTSPFAELKKAHPQALIGMLDIAARPFIDKNLLLFAVSGDDFRTMCEDTPECFFHGTMWKPMKKRLEENA